jgi:nicotinate-nucleotide adenylyltransferase
MTRQRDSIAKKQICLFGGTFDPIHLGHTHIAAAAVEQFDLDRVIFLPCQQSPHKPGENHAGAQHRLAMCRLATSAFDWAQVDDHDLVAPVPSYSWRTAKAMRLRFPDARIFWLMGTDQWQELPRWGRPEYLSDLVEFIVFTRGDEPEPRHGYRMQVIRGDHPASATAIRHSAADQLMTRWLHPAVAEYISAHSLYS